MTRSVIHPSGSAPSAVSTIEATLHAFIHENVADDAEAIHTDAWQAYGGIGDADTRHEFVSHNQGEYVRGIVHTNTVEGYFSVFKRGMRGTYQHCKEKHLHRYLAEFDFRYNARVARGVNDRDRAEMLLRGVKGKRLTYR